MFGLQQPRHISTLPDPEVPTAGRRVRFLR
jgi:hypothetical protein